MARTIINITLLLLLLLFADKAYNAFVTEVDTTIFSIANDAGVVNNADSLPQMEPLLSRKRPVQEFSVIHEKDLFRRERNEYIPPKIEEVEEIIVEPVVESIARPELILHGVLKLKNTSYALIEDKSLPPEIARGRKYKEGEFINKDQYGFKITRIQPDKVVVTKDDSSFEIMLFDEKKGVGGKREPAETTKTKLQEKKRAKEEAKAAEETKGKETTNPMSEIIKPKHPRDFFMKPKKRK